MTLPKMAQAVATAILALTAGIASAQPATSSGKASVTQQEYQARMALAFAKQDVDADGYLSRGLLVQEISVEQLAAMDTDGDGRVSKAEYLAHAMKGFRE
ncbi:EF-hand domain-containing protein [Achromobacter seleniivolatilans]|uniref:EF-hand domain-containing protein n=1 Tax=Achromobacter seleniivolatilans TaxID=3047478 RepID=A0ABY9LZU8_9BURK|nr:EF-hand domain-containing protein [Achromobacter sp. R39]WMD19980.1 EF-hand domain-containing protein [Achromobacter sp. R39]